MEFTTSASTPKAAQRVERRSYLMLTVGALLLVIVAGGTLWLVSLLRSEHAQLELIASALQQTRALRAQAGAVQPAPAPVERDIDSAMAALRSGADRLVDIVSGFRAHGSSSARLAAAGEALKRAAAGTGDPLAAARTLHVRAGDLENLLLWELAQHQVNEQEVKPLAWLVAWSSVFSLLLIVWSGQRIRDELARRHAVEAALAERERVYRTIVDNAHDAFISIDAKGTIIDWNRQAEMIFGWSREDALGRALGDTIVPPHHREAHAAGMKRYLASGESRIMGRTVEIDAVRRDGSLFPVELTLSPLTIDGARCFSAFLRDISARKKVERMKNEFVSIVSHELRTPLTAIAGSLQLVAADVAGPLPDEARQLVRVAHENSDRLVRLVNDILDVERIESGALQFESQTLGLREVLEQAVAANQAYAGRFGVTFDLAVPADAAIRFDRDRLLQVMTNLLSNAVKYSPRGEAVRVRAIVREHDVRVEISDRGPGIPDEFRSRIFQRFAQADASDARRKEGTGLGLNICHAIMKRGGGRIGFDSVAGSGATFWFELDRAAGDRS